MKGQVKKRISILLIILFSLSLFNPISVVAKNPQSSANNSPAMAQAYLNVISDITAKYAYSEYGELLYAKLSDFDSDGINELYMLYSDDYNYYIDAIWGFDGSNAYLIGENTYQSYGVRTNTSFGLKLINNKPYLSYLESEFYDAVADGKNVMVQSNALRVQEAAGRQLKQSFMLFSYYTYDEGGESLIDQKFFKGNDYDDREGITLEEFEKLNSLYSLKESEVLIESIAGYMEFYSEGYSLDAFLDELKAMLMTNSMGNTYINLARDEKKKIVDFLNQFVHSSYDGIDVTIEGDLEGFMFTLLAREPNVLAFEEPKTNDPWYEDWEEQRLYKIADVNKIALDIFGSNLDFYSHTPDRAKDGKIYVHQPWDAHPLYVTKINNLFPVGDNLFYLSIELSETWSHEYKSIIDNSLYEELPQNIKRDLYGSRNGYALIREVVKNGQKSYQLLKYSISNGFLTEEELRAYIKIEEPASNILIDYNKMIVFKDGSQYVSYLKELISSLNGEVINNRGKQEIITFLQFALENISSLPVKGKKNNITIDEDVIIKAANKLEGLKNEFNKVLGSNNIQLNKTVDSIIRINVENFQSKGTMSVTIDKSVAKALEEAAGVRVYLGDNQHSVYISNEDFKGIAEDAGTITIKLQRGKDIGEYKILFFDKAGKEHWVFSSG